MKINSHLLGFIIGGIAIAGAYWFIEKEIETYKGWRIFLGKNRYHAEYVPGNVSPRFETLAELKAWIDVAIANDEARRANAIPWGN